MLCSTGGDPARQAVQNVSRPTVTSSLKHNSRAFFRRLPHHRAQNATSTPLQATTALGGSHGTPCASAAAAAAAPTAIQELLMQADDDTQCQAQAQHHIDVDQVQLHQFQHHDQVLLQQQLEHLHLQQHQQQWQRHKQQLPQPQQQQERWQRSWHERPAEEVVKRRQAQQAGSALHQQIAEHQWTPGIIHRSARYADEGVQLLPQRGQHVQPASRQGHGVLAVTCGDMVTGNAAVTYNSPTAGGDGCCVATAGSFTPAAAAATLQPAVAPLGHRLQGGMQAHQQPHPTGTPSSWLPHSEQQGVANQAADQQHWQGMHRLKERPPRQQPKQQQAERTPTGVALVRLHKGSRPTQVAALLHSCLLQEQQVVLSAAGAQLALTALHCLERAVTLQQQQQPGSLLLAVPRMRQSKRPGGQGGRCQVFDLVCRLQHGVLEVHQTRQQQDGAAVGRACFEQAPQPHTAAAAESCWQQQQRQQQHASETQSVLRVDPSQHSIHQKHEAAHLQRASPSCTASSKGVLAASTAQHPAVAQHEEQQQQQQRRVQVLQTPMQLAAACSGGVLASKGITGSRMQLPLRLGAYRSSNWQQPGREPVQQGQQMSQVQRDSGVGGSSHTQQQQLQHGGLSKTSHLTSALQQKSQLSQQQQLDQQQGSLVPEPQPPPQQQQPGCGPVAPTSCCSQQLLGVSDPAAAEGVTDPVAHVSNAPGSALDDASAAPMVAAVQLLKVSGCSVDFADGLEDALLAGTCGAVQLPVAHPKQAVRALEAISIVSRRWQQRHRQLAASEPLAGSSSNSLDGSSGVNEAAEQQLQLVVEPRRGKVQGQAGGCRGLHVFVYAAPFVH